MTPDLGLWIVGITVGWALAGVLLWLFYDPVMDAMDWVYERLPWSRKP